MTRDLRAVVEAFFSHEILPRHREWLSDVACGKAAPLVGELQAKARAGGLWNLALPDRCSNRDYAPLAETWGACRGRPKCSTARRPTCPT